MNTKKHLVTSFRLEKAGGTLRAAALQSVGHALLATVVQVTHG